MKKGDKIAALIIIVLLVISTAGVLIYKNRMESSSRIALIKQDGKLIKTINLSTVKNSEEFIIKYKDNDFNKIKVEKGRIRITDANCPDKICVKKGWISKPGENIVCLPHRLIISIDGKNSNYDDITR